jgi:hypothetical protein
MNTAVFVLSTGRCGTQWLARFLEVNLGAAATVTHEPLHSAWSPREMLAAGTPDKLDEKLRRPIGEHLRFIREVLRERMYIECGHPSWSSVPYLVDTFAPDVRVIHLVRHPVPTAWSWLTHRAFCEPLLPHLPEKVLLSPFDEGVQFPEYRERWSSMSPFEKALYYWLEVNAFGRVHSRSAGEWLTLSFDELFDPAMQRRVLSFVTASEIDAEPKSPGHVDELRSLIEIEVDPMEIARHPEVLRLAVDLGFDPMRFDAERLRRRYAAV